MLEPTTDLSTLRETIRGWKSSGLRIGFVPTMGNLHAGHFSLIRIARQHADRVVASVFVNPTQFGPGEDYDRYPRTPAQDVKGLDDAGCDLLWMPSVAQMYPLGIEATVRVQVPGITSILDGAHRPGHFDGVATVVSRLFNQVQPDVAVFGRKDYQQLAVIRHLVQDLAFPIELVGAETLREPDGLAMSSRNQYLDAAQRALAPVIHQTLQGMRDAFLAGQAVGEVEAQGRARLADAGFDVDYAVLRDAALAVPVRAPGGRYVALVAARLGGTRLIDNLEFTLQG